MKKNAAHEIKGFAYGYLIAVVTCLLVVVFGILAGTAQAACGDGTLDTAEQCDDGATTGGDGCSVDCTVEPQWICRDEPSQCSENGGLQRTFSSFLNGTAPLAVLGVMVAGMYGWPLRRRR